MSGMAKVSSFRSITGFTVLDWHQSSFVLFQMAKNVTEIHGSKYNLSQMKMHICKYLHDKANSLLLPGLYSSK